MKPARRALPAVILSLFAGTAVPSANAAQFSGVVVFGDSLSDVGFYRPVLAAQGVPASLVATLGRFTTNPGPVWSELVSQYYGFMAAPSNASGSVYAQGGATVATDIPSSAGNIRSVKTQIGEYLTKNSGAADPRALYAIWAGGNDFLNNFSLFSTGQITQAQLQSNFLGAATAEIQQVARLYGAGARYVAVFTLPDIGSTPYALAAGAAAAGAATQLSAGYNTSLLTGLASAGLRVIPVDIFALFTEMRTNPAAFGFTNTTGVACGPLPPFSTSANAQFCYSANLVAPNADQTYVFADSVHPTTASHRIIADFTKSLIEGPTQYSLFAEVPLRTRMGHVQTLNDGLMIGQETPPGTIAAFAATAGGGFDVNSEGTNPGFGSTNRSNTVGVTMRASEAVTVGAGFGKSKADGSFGQEAGGFRTSENVFSIFAGTKLGGFYGNAAASISNIQFTQSRRTFRLGPATRTGEATLSGSNASAFVNAGYDFTMGRFAIGPLVSWTTQNVDVNAFDETGAGSAGLHIAAQNRRSEVGSFGVRASMKLGNWTPYLKYTVDKERKDEERLVSATPLSLASGNTYDMPAYQPADSTWGTFSAGIRGWFTETVGASIGYMKVTGRSGIKEDSVAGVLTVRF